MVIFLFGLSKIPVKIRLTEKFPACRILAVTAAVPLSKKSAGPDRPADFCLTHFFYTLISAPPYLKKN
jgi:hypothetical protein